MSPFKAFVKKEFYHILRDRRTMLILLALPIVQIVLFGFALSTEVRDVRVAVCNPSADPLARQIIDRIEASEYFTVTQQIASPAEANRLFADGRASLVVVFAPRFGSRLLHGGDAAIQLLADGTDPNQALQFTNYATAIIRSSAAELPAGASVRIAPTVRVLYNPQLKSAYNFVPGVMGMVLMLVCAMMTAIAIVREKETGTIDVLLVSPLRPSQMLLAKLTPYFTISMIDLLLVLLLARYLMGVPLAGNIWALVAVSMLFIGVALAFGLLVSTVANTQVSAMLATGLGLLMPTMWLSGMAFPVESMPAPLQWLSALLPVRWYIDIVRKLMIQGVPLLTVWKETAILALMAIAIATAGLAQFSRRTTPN